MRKNVWVLLAALCVAVCGCAPTLVQDMAVEEVNCVCADGALYFVGLSEQAALADAFEAWKRAGFDGFGPSVVTYVPSLSLIGKRKDGAVCKIEFGTDCVVVSEGSRELSQYVRSATAADAQFRRFLLKCLADGKFRRENAYGGK